MKKRFYYITTILLSAAVLSLSSCLKDSRYVDFSKGTPVVEFNLGGLAYYGQDAITETTDTVVKQFAVSVTTAAVPTTATTVQIAVDNSIINSYVAANPSVNFLPLPTGTYSLSTTTVNIPAGQRVAIVTLTIYKGLLDPTLSYMLPIKIVSTTGGYTLSGNMSVHYYHIIGNDFAGPYEHFYTRWNTPDTVSSAPSTNHVDEGQDIFTPISPTEFTVVTDYYTAPRYDVNFTKTGTGAAATYSDFTVKFYPADIAAGTQWATNITVVNSPKILPQGYQTNPYDPSKQYTYAQALKLFRFYFTTASRSLIDEYIHP